MKPIYTILIGLLFFFNTNAQNVDLVEFANNFDSPVNIQHAGDDRLFIVEQSGRIKILEATGNTLTTPFLDINTIVSSGGERGLLGLAFHPNYTTNGLFYVNYTNNVGDTVIAQYNVSLNPNVADVSSGLILLTINQPYSNHNGGSIVFGPDGYLYIGMGDGGSSGDPDNNAQNGNSLLGKILRIEVGLGLNYNIPNDNPFIDNSSIRNEIWAIGVRNPWKFSFDRLNGDLWIADVGQNVLEEIDHVIGTGSGLNYGWRCYEGNGTYNTAGCEPAANYVFPVAEYAHGGNPYRCSITGGFVYRGTTYPNFNGLYFFADYCSDEIGTVDPNNGNQITFNSGFDGSFSTFGQDINGELYVASLNSGKIFKIIDQALSLSNSVLQNDFELKPNPANKNVIINSISGNFDIKQLTVYNLIGSKVIDIAVFNKNTYNLEVRDLKKGVYFIKIKINNANFITKKLIIK